MGQLVCRTASGLVRVRSGALLGAAALALGLFGSSGAQAQPAPTPVPGCTTTGLAGVPSGITAEAAALASTTNSFISVINTMNTAFLAQGSAFVGSPPSPIPDQTAGGVWIRGIGGELTTKSTGTVDNVSFGGTAPIPGSITCDTKVRQNYGGIQVGQDIATLNLGGTGKNVHFGITAGYGESNAHDNTGIFNGNFQVPFVGVYSVFTWGNFFFDTLSRWDFYQTSLNSPIVGILNQPLDARGISFTASAGYRFDVGNNWFVEPSAGLIHSVVKVDTLNLAGSGPAPPAYIQFNDVQSTLGRAGVRVGTSFTAGNLALQPFVTASVWHEFEGPATANYQSFTTFPPSDTPLLATLSSSRVGTYGQYSVGLAGQVVNTGWLGYVRVDFREGPNIEGVSVNGGIRYQFNPEVPVQTAGIFKAPVHVPASVAAAPYNWTGFYIGGFLGTAWGETSWSNVDDSGENTFPRFAGILGGGQVGYNFQTGPWVVGLEGDLGWTNEHGSEACPNGFFVTCTNRHVNPLGTATARLGYAWNRALFFVKGGGAWTRDNYQTSDNTTGGIITTASDSRGGWTVGAGLEFGLAPNWSAKVEYAYLDFGTRHVIFDDGETADIRKTVNEIKIGVNYRFGGPGEIAVPAPVLPFPTKAPAFPTKAPPLVAPTSAVFNWRGCYVGVAGGGAWGRSHHDTNGTLLTQTALLPPPAVPIAITGDFDVSGAIIGGTTGCNLLQSGNWVFGVESDFSGTTKKGSTLDLASFTAAVGISENSETSERWLSTNRVRVGYAWDNWLLYATAGAAVGDVRIQACDATVSAVGCLSESHTRAGWTVGGGVEWAFMPNWSAKLEYLYADFGRTDYFNPPPFAVQQPPSNVGGIANRTGGVFLNDNIVRVGVNWRFNLDLGKTPTPVVTKY